MKKRNDFSRRIDSRAITRTLVLGGALHGAACGGTSATTTSATPTAHPHDGHHATHGGHEIGGSHAHRFDDAARWSKLFDDPARDEWQKPARVVEVMEITPGMRVADIGAGTGYFEPHLARAVGPTGRVFAEDVEPSMVQWIKERASRDKLSNVEAVLGTSTDPNLPPESLDRVLIVDTWHHIADRTAYAAKLAKLLAPRGAIFVVDFTPESPHGPPPAVRTPAESVRRDLAAAGLTSNLVEGAGLPHQYVVRGTRDGR